MKPGQRRKEVILLCMAGLAWAAGILVYVVDRGGHGDFLSAWWTGTADLTHFASHALLLPVFLPTPAFAPITAAILRPWPDTLSFIAAAGMLAGCLFEPGQRSSTGSVITEHLPAPYSGVPLLEASANHPRSGTFDRLDIPSIGRAATLAYLFMLTIRQRGVS